MWGREVEVGPVPGDALILPDNRLVDFGMVGILGLDVPGLGKLLATPHGRGGDIGSESLAEGLDSLAPAGELPTLSGLLEVARAELPPLAAGLGAHPDEVGPQTARFLAQSVAQRQGGGRHVAQPGGRGIPRQPCVRASAASIKAPIPANRSRCGY
jgi:hypothetical protein